MSLVTPKAQTAIHFCYLSGFSFYASHLRQSAAAAADHQFSRHRPPTICQWTEMEAMVKKYQQKFRKVREEMEHWEELQSQLVSQFSNASSIIERLQVIGDKKYYGSLKVLDGIEEAVLRKQMESLGAILLSIKKTMEGFHRIVLSLEKVVRDSKQLVRGGSHPLSIKQLQQRIGVKPSLSDCLDGLTILHEMYSSEYLLKTSVVSALLKTAFKPSGADLGALRQLLVDQPNVSRDEVDFIFGIIFAEEIC